MSSQSWLISGASRGIGFEVVKIIAARPNTIVFAGARSPSKATQLQRLAATSPNVHVIQLESNSVSDAAAAAKTVEQVAGGLDVVIANAGIGSNWQPATEVDLKSMNEHFQVNTVGPLILFQALYPALLKHQTRKFITISSTVGSLATNYTGVADTVYGASKAALNFVTKSIAKEHTAKDGIIAIPLHPGGVDTDLGKTVASVFGREKMPVTVEDSAEGVIKVIDNATVEQSGHFLSYDGTEVPW